MSKTIFIKDITGSSGIVVDFFLIAQLDIKAKKDGTPYWDLKLQDKTGTINLKVWDVPEFSLEVGDYLKVDASVSTYKGSLQMTLRRMRLAHDEEIEKTDFMRASSRDRGEMYDSLLEIVCKIENEPLRAAVLVLMENNRSALMECPAAKTMHQPWLGGLMEHVLGIANCAIRICEVYPQLNRDVMIAGAIVHDIGKVEELVWSSAITYGRMGSLVGHIPMGITMWSQVSMDVDPALRDHVAHIIASHHGQKEWGAVAVPQTKEAVIFHLIDCIDAKLNMFELAIENGVDDDGRTSWNNTFGMTLWNGK